MIIGIDAKRYFQNTTGLGNYSRTLVNALVSAYPQETFHLYTPGKQTRDSVAIHFAEYPKNIHLFRPEGTVKGSIWRTFFMAKTLKKNGVDVYHGLSHEVPYGIEIPSVVTMHDTISLDHPEQYKAVDRFIYQQKMAYACKQSRHIVAISEATRADIIRHFNVPENKISVVYQGIAPHFNTTPSQADLDMLKQRHQLPEKFILSVGSVIIRKRLLPALQAFARYRKRNGADQLHFVVVGKGQEYFNEVLQFVADEKLEKYVHFLQEVRNEELPALYRLAQLFVYPSVSEGFGIPLIEAFSQEVPVITSCFSCLPEVSAGAALEINPDDPQAFDQALETALHNEEFRSFAREKGKERYRFFNQGDQARQMMEIYREIAQ